MREKKVKMTQSEIDGVVYRRSSTWRIICSQGAFLSMAIMGVLLTYVTYLQSAGYGIAVAAAGVVLTVVTIFSSITDPIAARIIDNVNTRFGKLRLFLGLSWLFSAAAMYTMFCVTSNGNFGMVTFIVVCVLYYIGYAFFCVTQSIIPAVLTNDPTQRPLISMWGTLIGIFPPIIFMVYVTAVVLPKYGNQYTIPLLKEMCIIVLVVSFIGTLLSMIGVSEVDKKENFEGVNSAKETIKFRDMVKMFKENKALQSYMWSAASDRLATTMAGQAVLTTLMYGVLMRNLATASLLNMIPMVVGMIALVPVAKKNGKMGSKESMVLWSVLGLVISAVQVIFYTIVMVSGNMDKMLSSVGLLVIFLVLSAVRNIAVNGNGNSTNMMIADVIDYQCYLTGKYMPAAITATYSFIDKLINAFGSTITLGLISLVGYKMVMPQPTDEATMPIFIVTMFVTLGTPAIGWIVNLIALKMSPLSREKMIEVQKEIKAKKEAMEA